MTLLIVSVACVLIVSGLCSLSEASLYAVRMPFVRTLADSGSYVGRLLSGFKDNMERPISAILIVNTVANTAGAAIAGAQARDLFGENAFIWFSAVFTVSVLLCAEILPKIVGVVYSENVSRLIAFPLTVMTWVLFPVVFLIDRLSQLIRPDAPIIAAPEEEVVQLATMSAEEGSILHEEAELVRNALRLNDVPASQIMTPRSVVTKFSASMTVGNVAESVDDWTYARMPVYSESDPDTWSGFVLRRDILTKLASGSQSATLESLIQPLTCVPSTTPANELLKAFVEMKTHLFAVSDEFNHIVGVVTLEDVIEELIGDEIVDEVDVAVDMQAVARQQMSDYPDDRHQ